MKFGAEDRKKLAILGFAGAGALGAVLYMVSELAPSSAPTPPAASVTATASSSAAPAPASRPTRSGAASVGTTSASLDPTLHMGPMLVTEALQYRGNGRNIFSSAPSAATGPALPRPIAPARPTAAQTASATQTAPAGPPPIDLRFFGTATRVGQTSPRAFLLRGDDVYLASVGDIVQRRYKVVSITANALTVQDLTDNHQQTLPIAAN